MSDFFHSIENVPYTDLHNLNLDWIVNTMKTTVEQWIAYKAEMDSNYADFTELTTDNYQGFVDTVTSDIEEIREYVNTYFDNLDLNQATQDVIDSMVESGEFLTIIRPEIGDAVEAWLDEHITETTPIIDKSLTIAGAGADAETTGIYVYNLADAIQFSLVPSFVKGNIFASGENIGGDGNNQSYIKTDFISAENFKNMLVSYKPSVNTDYYVYLFSYDESQNYLTHNAYIIGPNRPVRFYPVDNAGFIRICVRYTVTDPAITVEEGNNVIYRPLSSGEKITDKLEELEEMIDNTDNRKFVEYDLSNTSLWEQGSANPDGSLFNNSNYIRTKPIYLYGNNNGFVYVPSVSTEYNYYVLFYNYDGTANRIGSLNIAVARTITVPVNTAYFRVLQCKRPVAEISVSEAQAMLFKQEFNAWNEVQKAVNGENSYIPAVPNSYNYFTVTVNKHYATNPDTSTDTDSYEPYNIKCVLYLPNNYTDGEEKTKLCVFSQGTGTFVGDNSTTGFFVNVVNYGVGRYGYAVLMCNGIGDDALVEGMNMGSPIAVQALSKAVEYCIKNYNLEDRVCLCGSSMGALLALNWFNENKRMVKAINLLYPAIDLYNQCWLHPWRSEVKPTIAKWFGFDDDTGNTWEENKTIGFNPIKNNSIEVDGDRYSFGLVPIKMWHGGNDSTINKQYTREYTEQINRAGNYAEYREIAGVGHGVSGITTPWLRELHFFFDRY